MGGREMEQKQQNKPGEQSFWRKNIGECIVVFLCTLLFTFVSMQKEGFHMDEMLSFELSNAEFNPWIVPTQPQGRLARFVEEELRGAGISETWKNLTAVVADVLSNGRNSKLLSYKAAVYEEPVFISRNQFENYITVGEADGFNFLSVYFNVKDDNHPPLHFMTLHIVSSIFRHSAEPLMGCLINIAAVVGSMLLLITVGRRMAVMLGIGEQAKLTGILAALLYGLSVGALSTVLLIRMYGMLTFFCVALFAIHIRKWQENGFEEKNKVLILVTVLGFWTQYFFLFYCFLLAAVTAAGLLIRRNRKGFLVYVRSMLLSGMIGILGFPFAISDVLSSGRGVEAVQNFASGFRGYGARIQAFGGILADNTMVLWLMASVVLLWGISVWKKKHRTSEKGESGMLSFLLLPALGYFLLAARMSPYYVDRYVMPIFPFVALAGATGIVYMAERIGWEWHGKYVLRVTVVCLTGIMLWKLAAYDGEYLYKGYGMQEKIAQDYAADACICVYDGVGYYENLKEFTHYEKTLLTTLAELEERKERESIDSLDEVVVLAKSEVDWEELRRLLKEEYGLLLSGELLQNGVHGDRIGLFAR